MTYIVYLFTNLNACTEAKGLLCFLGHLQCHLDIDKIRGKTEKIEDISRENKKNEIKNRIKSRNLKGATYYFIPFPLQITTHEGRFQSNLDLDHFWSYKYSLLYWNVSID